MSQEQQALLLVNLQQQNATRWEELKALHRRLPPATHPPRSLNEYLQIESDLLNNSRKSKQSKETEIIVNEDDAASEVVATFDDLCVANADLEAHLKLSNERLQQLQQIKDELLVYKTELEEEFARNDVRISLSENGNHQVQDPSDAVSRHKESLKYVAERMERAKPRNGKRKKHGKALDYWSLDRLVQELVHRLVRATDVADTYLAVDDVNNANPEHVELFKKHGLIELLEDNDRLIRLIDFRD